MACSIFVVLLTLLAIGISARKIHLMRVLKDEIFTHNECNKSDKSPKNKIKLFMKTIKNTPNLANWVFLLEDMNPELLGFWMHFFLCSAVKDLLVVFFVITLIGNPLFQIIPSMILSFLFGLILIFKKPFERKLSNFLNFFTECAYFMIYATFLTLHLTSVVPENQGKRSTIGIVMITMIGIVICRCLVDLVMGVVEII